MCVQKFFFWLKKVMVTSLFFLCKFGNAQSFTLNGTIEGKHNGYVILHYINAKNQNCSDTTSVIHGKFKFNGTVNGADYAVLDTDTNYISGDNTNGWMFFIEPGVITIAFNYGDYGSIRITGSKVQEELDAFHKSKSNEIRELKRFSASVDSIRSLLKNGSIDPQIASNQIKDLNKKYAPSRLSYIKKDLSYIEKHPDSYLSLFLLKYSTVQMSTDSVDMFYSNLSDRIKGSSLDFGFLDFYSKYKKAIGEEYPFDKIRINETAPVFSVYNESDTINLNTFKDRVLLLEFWELTCLPCLQANPQLENIRKKNSQKFKIIGITTTSLKEMPKMISYINKNNIPDWIHVSLNVKDLEENDKVFGGQFDNYKSLGVPKSVLIDKSGKVIYKNFGYSSEEIQKLELLINKAVAEE